MKKIAVLGSSHIHAPGFSDILMNRSDVEVVTVWDPDPAIAQKYASKFNCRSMTEVSSILNMQEIDAVVVMSQTIRHESLALQIAESKKHCYIEKPLGIGQSDAKKIKQALESAGVIFQTGHFKRSQAPHRFIKQLLSENRFGKISRIRLDFGTTAIFNDIFHNDWLWMTDLNQSGIGAFGDLGIHLLDLLLWFMQDLAKLEAVTAIFRHPIQMYPGGEVCGEAFLRFDNGTLASFSASWIDYLQPTSLIISGTEGHAQMRCKPGMPANIDEKVYDDLFLLVDSIPGATGKEPWTELPDTLPSPLDLFLDAVVTKQPEHLVSVKEAAYRSYVMESIYQGAAKQNWVKIDPNFD